MVCDSGDEMEVDEEEARTKMKTILKTFLIELELIYDEKFSSESNDEILQQIIPQLIEAIKSRYTPRYRQVKSWFTALYKHCRVRLLYKQRDTLDKDNHCLHRNNQLNEVNNFFIISKKNLIIRQNFKYRKKACRVKSVKSLFNKNDEKLENYDRKELLNVLSDNRYHSPEYSESDEEQSDGKRHINVYNLSWRSEELIDLLRNILDQHAFSLQSAQLIRT
ncbi:hypothetical protein RhiirA1_450080 [Rhizophagus irregularis]|uniref:Uncharacterized protein n=1 Tax=Rhizophagus irregularis TaxID=588596 RepID=A0A2N0SFU6_9GLOM|nr:hypothetical protein RhiirA1_450080 [Rhizophagus irregularis]